MRLLAVAIVLLLVALVVWALVRRAALRAAAENASGDAYRVLETTGDGQAHVFIARAAPDTSVLIGSVAVKDPDFDERYATLVAQAEDRAATLNASRQLHSGG